MHCHDCFCFFYKRQVNIHKVLYITGHIKFYLTFNEDSYLVRLPQWLSGKESCNTGDIGDLDFIFALKRCTEGGNGNKCSCMDNPMDRGA